jgi:hypothetical protein
MPTLGRRALIAGGTIAAGAGLIAYLQGHLQPVPVARMLLDAVDGTLALREPETTGVPSVELTSGLWLLFSRIAERWQMSDFIDLNVSGFTEIVRLKCAVAPSYLTEYRETARLLAELEPGLAGDPASLDQLFTQPEGLSAFGATRLGRMQAFVIGEFLELQMAYGGFRAFGYANYRGYAGGVLGDPDHPPFRTASGG